MSEQDSTRIHRKCAGGEPPGRNTKTFQVLSACSREWLPRDEIEYRTGYSAGDVGGYLDTLYDRGFVEWKGKDDVKFFRHTIAGIAVVENA